MTRYTKCPSFDGHNAIYRCNYLRQRIVGAKFKVEINFEDGFNVRSPIDFKISGLIITRNDAQIKYLV
jgi:hypothetical protein